MITHVELESGRLSLLYGNGKSQKSIGLAVLDVDGYYYFWSNENDGLWSSYSLRLIADKLEELNKDWDEKISQEFKRNCNNV